MRSPTPGRARTPIQNSIVTSGRWSTSLLAVLAAAQSLVLANSTGPFAPKLLAILLGIGALVVLWRPAKYPEGASHMVAIAIAVNLIAFVVAGGQAVHRLFLTACVLGYGAVTVAIVASRAFKLSFEATVVAALLVALPLQAMEIALEAMQRSPAGTRDAARAVAAPRPTSERGYAPNSTQIVRYPDDARGYFESSATAARVWRLDIPDNVAAARFFPDTARPDRARLEVDRLGTGEGWQIQAIYAPLQLEAQRLYRLGFRVRASATRLFALAISQDHPPYELIGPYRTVRADTGWQVVRESFRAARSDPVARLQIHAGMSLGTLEFSDVTIADETEGKIVRAAAAGDHFLTYRFNESGCRARDVAPTRAKNVKRILVLGDSYALGAGVRQEDTYSSRLEVALRDSAGASKSATQFEVFNCGVSGYSTADERKLYSIVSARYAPNLVLVGVVPGDSRSSMDDVPGLETASVPALDRLFLFIGVARRRLSGSDAQREDADVIVRELRLLRDSASAHNARVAIVLAADPRSDKWRLLSEQLIKALGPDGIPVLDVSPLLRPYQDEDLRAHPTLDAHPSDLVHRVTADALVRFLRQNRLLE